MLEKHINNGGGVIIQFKDGNGKYHTIMKSFDTYEDYESYCDTRMRQSGWKEIGTHIPDKKETDEQPKSNT